MLIVTFGLMIFGFLILLINTQTVIQEKSVVSNFGKNKNEVTNKEGRALSSNKSLLQELPETEKEITLEEYYKKIEEELIHNLKEGPCSRRCRFLCGGSIVENHENVFGNADEWKFVLKSGTYQGSVLESVMVCIREEPLSVPSHLRMLGNIVYKNRKSEKIIEFIRSYLKSDSYMNRFNACLALLLSGGPRINEALNALFNDDVIGAISDDQIYSSKSCLLNSVWKFTRYDDLQYAEGDIKKFVNFTYDTKLRKKAKAALNIIETKINYFHMTNHNEKSKVLLDFLSKKEISSDMESQLQDVEAELWHWAAYQIRKNKYNLESNIRKIIDSEYKSDKSMKAKLLQLIKNTGGYISSEEQQYIYDNRSKYSGYW